MKTLLDVLDDLLIPFTMIVLGMIVVFQIALPLLIWI